MGTNTKSLLFLFAVVAAVFLVAAERLVERRYSVGDTHPPYSTYRTDPLGMKVLYGALESLETVSVKRNLRPLELIEDGAGTTLLICNASLSDDPESLIEALEEFVSEGARFVITFPPLLSDPSEELDMARRLAEGFEPRDAEDEAEDEGEEEKEGEEELPDLLKMVSIEDRWGFKYAFAEGSFDDERRFKPVSAARTNDAPESLPSNLDWHTVLYFDELDEAWRVIYEDKGRAVFMVRPWGDGAIVLASDTYFLSNEALRNDRQTELVAWLLGPNRNVLFDETHLGTAERPGIMALARRYGLQGFLASLLVLAGLLVWQSNSSLAPKRDGDFAGSVEGPGLSRNAHAGLVNLLRRTIPADTLVEICAKEWERSTAYHRKDDGANGNAIRELTRAESQRSKRLRDPVALYQTICTMLAERK